MMNYEEKLSEATGILKAGERRVRETPEPEGQKFPVGARVRIAKDLGGRMILFTNDANATVEYTYAHAYGGKNVKDYSLNIDGKGSSAWYHEWQLELIKEADTNVSLKNN